MSKTTNPSSSDSTPMKVLLIGKSGRVHAIADSLTRGSSRVNLYSLSEVNNPGLADLSCAPVNYGGRTEDVDHVIEYAKKVQPDFAFIGPEEPLEAGVVDALAGIGIPSIGPFQTLARIESSKSFTRELLTKYGIPGNPNYKTFSNTNGVREYLQLLEEYVVKPDGLTGGKGVKVSGDHLSSISEGVEYCAELFASGQKKVVIEEKLVGEEFSLQAFSDGDSVVNTIPIQDHKRAFNDDTGPNTGGMGSYSSADHLLPFLSQVYLDEASEINRLVAAALKKETGKDYIGILYGGFMVTRKGLRLIEYNARFGDPEVMNVLPLLETDFLDVCSAMLTGKLSELEVTFRKAATVCKYVVPQNYPNPTTHRDKVKLENQGALDVEGRVFYGAVHKNENSELELIGSRAVACVGIGSTLDEAERSSELLAQSVVGNVRHRSDIGSKALIDKRMANIADMFSNGPDNVAVGMKYLYQSSKNG